MQIRNFDEGVTVMFPKKKENMDVYVEKKKSAEKKDWDKKYPSIPNGFDLIDVVINIAFFVLGKNGEKEYVGDLKPPAVIRIRYDKKVVEKADKKGKKKVDLKVGWWENGSWNVFPSTIEDSKHNFKNKQWQGYIDVKTSGWADDPPVGWGC